MERQRLNEDWLINYEVGTSLVTSSVVMTK